MDLKDFVKEIAVKLDKNNVEKYRKIAASLVINQDIAIEELAKIINSTIYYDDLLEMFSSKKDMLDAVKRVMTETDDLLSVAREFYIKNKKSFSWFNKTTKDWLASPLVLVFSDMTDSVIDYWLDNPNSLIYTDSSKLNHFFNVINTEDKKLVTKVINHKNFKNIPSYTPLLSLLTTLGYENLLTKTTFNKVFSLLVSLMNKMDIEVIESLSVVIKSPFIELKHIEIAPTEQQISIYNYILNNKITVSSDISEFFYNITGDISLLPKTAQDVFVF